VRRGAALAVAANERDLGADREQLSTRGEAEPRVAAGHHAVSPRHDREWRKPAATEAIARPAE
jgi:hypothetical protein